MQAFQIFNIAYNSNLYLVKLVSLNCQRSSLTDFFDYIIGDQIRRIVELDPAVADEKLKNIIVGQLFEIILTCGRGIDYSEYTKNNYTAISSRYDKLIDDYLGEEITDPLSLYVLKFFNLLLNDVLNGKVKVDQEVEIDESVADKAYAEEKLQKRLTDAAQKVSFKMFIQHTVVPKLLK